MEGESIDQRLDWLSDQQWKDILKRIIESLIANGSAMKVSDILWEHSLLTRDEAYKVFVNSKGT